MTLAPLLAASPVIQAHAMAALTLIPMSIAMITLPKGTSLHKAIGRIWVIGMAVVALSNFGIHEIKMIGGYSPIHLLSLFTLAMLIMAIHAAKSGNIKRHKTIMTSLIWGALVGAGAFTMLPGRIMYAVVFKG